VITAKKALGQHFLNDQEILTRIVAEAAVGPRDVVLEVGPGAGALTEHLQRAAGRVVAVEVDPALCRRLRERLPAWPNVSLVEADVLSRSPAALLAAAGLPPETDYVLLGNLPFNIGAAVLRHFLEAERPPLRATVMLQREVATAIAAPPGRLGLLAVSVQVYAEARCLFDVPARAFQPPPKITSSILRLDRRPTPLVAVAERDHFFAVVRAGFSAPRKQLANSLALGWGRSAAALRSDIEAAGLAATARPQDLDIAAWRRLAARLS